MVVGIDLGTTFSAIASLNEEGKAEIIQNREGENTTPSVVMFDGGAIIVGESAKDNSISDPENVCQFVKRKIGDKSYVFRTSDGDKYTAEEISAMVLKRLKEDAEEFKGEDIEGAVITVPAYFQDAQRMATKDAGEIAGLEVLGIINEPTAAAIAYGYDKRDFSGNVMVFDLGGGTFDITIMEMSDDFTQIRTLSTTGNRNLGGFDFDNLIIEKVKSEYKKQHGIDLDSDLEAMQDLRLKAETAKKTMSRMSKGSINISANGKRMRLEIPKEEFERMMRGYLDTMEGYMEDALEMAKLEWSDISKILLVGGSTRIPCVQAMIENISGIAPSFELNADEAVALGACYYAENVKSSKTGKKNATGKSVEIIDVTSHCLGVESYNKEKEKIQMSFIIEANTPIPAEVLDTGYKTRAGQKEWTMKILEGDDLDPAYDTVIFEQNVKVHPETPVIIYMRYDENGIVHAIPYETDDETDGQISIGVLLHQKDPDQFFGPKQLVEMFKEKLHPLASEVEVQRKSNLTREQVKSKKRNMDGYSIE